MGSLRNDQKLIDWYNISMSQLTRVMFSLSLIFGNRKIRLISRSLLYLNKKLHGEWCVNIKTGSPSQFLILIVFTFVIILDIRYEQIIYHVKIKEDKSAAAWRHHFILVFIFWAQNRIPSNKKWVFYILHASHLN